MKVLGIDPGLQTTGFGVVEFSGAKLTYIASGTISTTHLPRADLAARIGVLFEGISEVSQRYRPDTAALEIVFPNRLCCWVRRAARVWQRWCISNCLSPNTPHCK